MFWHPLILQLLIVGCCIFFGVRYRLYYNYLTYDRELEFAKTLDIDFEDVENYPKKAMEMLIEKRKYDKYIN